MEILLYGWPYAGLVLALVLVVGLALERRPAGLPRWQDPAFVLPLLWPMYLLHQFEEHGVDVLGRRYAFLSELCATLGHADLSTCPGDPGFLFAVNAVGCQIAFAFSLFYRRRDPLVAACAWGIPLVNAVTHLGGAAIHGSYNPGVLTSALLFLPLGAWMLRTVIRSGVVQPREVPRIFATGVAVHVVLMGSLALRGHGWISHGMLLALNAMNGLVPLAFGRAFARRPVAALAA